MRSEIDTSRVPAERRNKNFDKIVKDTNEWLSTATPAMIERVCLHEAAHAIYIHRAGFKTPMRGPSVWIDSVTNELDSVLASVTTGDLKRMSLCDQAKMLLAPATLIDRLTKQSGNKDREMAGDVRDLWRFFNNSLDYMIEDCNQGRASQEALYYASELIGKDSETQVAIRQLLFEALSQTARELVLADAEDQSFIEAIRKLAAEFRRTVFEQSGVEQLPQALFLSRTQPSDSTAELLDRII